LVLGSRLPAVRPGRPQKAWVSPALYKAGRTGRLGSLLEPTNSVLHLDLPQRRKKHILLREKGAGASENLGFILNREVYIAAPTQ